MYSFRLNNTQNITCNLYCANRNNGLSYISAFGPIGLMELIAKNINSRPTIINNRMFPVDGGKFKVITNRVPNSDYIHMVAYKEDFIHKYPAGNETIY